MDKNKLRNDVALAILVQMIPTSGDRKEKVRAAFGYAELFLIEAERYEVHPEKFGERPKEETKPWRPW